MLEYLYSVKLPDPLYFFFFSNAVYQVATGLLRKEYWALVVVFDHFKSCCCEIVCYISQNVLVKNNVSVDRED